MKGVPKISLDPQPKADGAPARPQVRLATTVLTTTPPLEDITDPDTPAAAESDLAAESQPGAEPVPELNAAMEEADVGGDGWSGAEIEEAYLKALQVMEDLPWSEPASAPDTDDAPEHGSGETAAATTAENTLPGETTEQTQSAAGHATAPVLSTPAPLNSPAGNPEPAARRKSARAPRTETSATQRTPTLRIASSEDDATSAGVQLSPRQVLEAALFVGGAPLTAKRMCGLLGGSAEPSAVEALIDELNCDYVAEERPYEIRLGDGGYRMALRPEYEKLRGRVYGVGPREVRLSQEVLELLALIAYKQPITPQEIEGYGRKNIGGPARQLLRRELIAIERGPGGRNDIRYHTTARFLSLFGLGSLEELPQAEDVEKK